MTETEYINATNLCRLRLIQSVMRDCTFDAEAPSELQRGILIDLACLIEDLESEVKCKPQYPKKRK